MMKKKATWIVLVIIVALIGSAFVYVEKYYHADQAAMDALQSDESVQISQMDYGWFFDGPSDEDALIFYPGGKVEETAYAPLLHELAADGMDVQLVKMPARLAILNTNAADDVRQEQGGDYKHWYIGGHSLGGVCAAMYAEKNEWPDGVVLLAAYSTKELDDDDKILLIYGSEDGVLNKDKYNENKKNVPGNAGEYVIEGGNHAQFGSYGEQKGDGQALISPEKQIRKTSQIILKALSE